MAIITAFPNGTLSQFATFVRQQSATYQVDPAATTSLDFDESTNAALIADLTPNWKSYTLPLVNSAPQLQKNGAAVTVAAPSALYSLQSAILNGIPDATLKAAIVNLWNGTATAQQQQRALAYALLKLKQAGLI